MSESKIESCKLIVLWMLKDAFNRANTFKLPTMTLDKILTSFTIVEKRRRIKQAIDELIKEDKVIRVRKTNKGKINYMINAEVFN